MKKLERLGCAAIYEYVIKTNSIFFYYFYQDDIVNIVATLETNEQRRTTASESVVPAPTPRSNFSFCAHPEKEELILFGGENYDGQKLSVYNELYFYNISKNEWKLVMAPGGPGPRAAHQMVSVAADGGQLWVFFSIFTFSLESIRSNFDIFHSFSEEK